MADACLHLFGCYFLVWVFVGWFVFGCGVAGGSLGLGCGRLRCLLSSAARRPLPSANSAVEDCLLCVLCKLGSGAFWPAKHIHCRRAAASAAAASVSLVLHTCLSCTYLYHAARSDAVRVPCVSALLTMLSPLRLSGSQAFFRVLIGPAVVPWILLATPGLTTRRQSL